MEAAASTDPSEATEYPEMLVQWQRLSRSGTELPINNHNTGTLTTIQVKYTYRFYYSRFNSDYTPKGYIRLQFSGDVRTYGAIIQDVTFGDSVLPSGASFGDSYVHTVDETTHPYDAKIAWSTNIYVPASVLSPDTNFIDLTFAWNYDVRWKIDSDSTVRTWDWTFNQENHYDYLYLYPSAEVSLDKIANGLIFDDSGIAEEGSSVAEELESAHEQQEQLLDNFESESEFSDSFGTIDDHDWGEIIDDVGNDSGSNNTLFWKELGDWILDKSHLGLISSFLLFMMFTGLFVKMLRL